MIYQVTFENAQHEAIEVVSFAVDSPREAAALLVNGTITWPEGTRHVSIEEVAVPPAAA